MTDRPNKANLTDAVRYLNDEMSSDERESFETRYFADEDLFFTVVAAEDDLVDRYVAGTMSPAETAVFERSLDRFPGRRDKMRNAGVLAEFIVAEKSLGSRPIDNADVSAGLWTRIVEFFTFRTPIACYAFAGLAVMLFVATSFLLLSNRSLSDENARLQANAGDSTEWKTNEARLKGELSAAEVREAELNKRLSGESEVKDGVTSDLVNERASRKQLETEVAKLRRSPEDLPPSKAPSQLVPTVALGKDGSGAGNLSPTVRFDHSAKQIAIVIGLPDSAEAGEQMTYSLNGLKAAGSLTARSDQKGSKYATVNIAAADLRAGANKIELFNKTGAKVAAHSFSVEK